jgi:hypothetical protein
MLPDASQVAAPHNNALQLTSGAGKMDAARSRTQGGSPDDFKVEGFEA